MEKAEDGLWNTNATKPHVACEGFVGVLIVLFQGMLICSSG